MLETKRNLILKKIFYLKDEDSAQIGSMLFQTQDSFLRLVREKKDALVKLFPELVETILLPNKKIF